MHYSHGIKQTVQVAGVTFVDIQNLIVLNATAVTGAVVYNSMYKAGYGQTRGVYQVPASKLFRLHAVKWQQNGVTAANALGGLFYGDTDLGQSAAGPLTNPVGVISGAAGITALSDLFITHGGSEYGQNAIAISGSVPASKYIHFYSSAGFGIEITIYGYEEAV